MKSATAFASRPGPLCLVGAVLALWVMPVRAALVSYTEIAVNDADGSTIGAVATSRYLELNGTYSTATAPTTWSSYRFTHWTYSGVAEALRDAWGRSVNPGKFTLLAASTATAHYLPTTRDSDGDGVPDWFEMEYFGTLSRGAADDSDGDGATLLAEYTAGTNPIYPNAVSAGGVAWADSALVTCNLAGYATYTLRSEPAGTVNQSSTVPPGTVVTTPNLSGTATFGYWTLDGVRQADAWGVALTQLTFTVGSSDREAVANLFSGDTDGDGVPDAYEQRYYGTLANGAASDSDGDGVTLLAEYASGTSPIYPNAAGAGGVAWTDSALVTCNLAGYATYTLRSEPAGTVNQTATVPPGTVVTTSNLSGNAGFGYWTLDGERQADAWGVAFTQLTFTVGGTDREAVAYLFSGDTDGDGVPDAFEQRHYGTLANGAASDTDGDGVTLAAEYAAGTHPRYANGAAAGGVAWVDSALLTLDLQADIALQQPAGTALADGGARDWGAVLIGQSATLTFKVRNAGGRALSGLNLSLAGADAAQFSVSPVTLASLAHNEEAEFTVRFTPLTVGGKTAALHLASNDPDENPFDVTLLGLGANNPPTLAGPDDTVTPRNTAASVAVTVGDVETSAGALLLTATSSDTGVVANAAIVVGGTGSARAVTITPATNATGTTRITLTVSDGDLTASTSFLLEVIAYLPVVGLQAADEVTSSSARLRGEVATQGFSTEGRFEYGTDTQSLATIAADLVLPDGLETHEASARIEGLQPWTTYFYRFAVSNSQGGRATDFGTFRTAGVAPEIVTQPESLTATVGDDVSLRVVATGVPTPTYVWWKGETVVAGAEAATLRFATVQTSDAGTYRVVVSNEAGSVTSREVTLTVQRRAQTIQFDPLPEKQVGDAPFALAATASSGLPVSYASSDHAVATINGATVSLVGPGTATITASQAGDATYLPATDVGRLLVVAAASELLTVLEDEFIGAAGAAPNAALYQWSGDIGLSGAGQLVLSTNSANHSWLRTIEGKAVAAGDTIIVRFRAYAYAEHWNPGVYGDRQPRGVRVGTDPNNAIEFYSVTRTQLGLRARKDGVETNLTYNLPGGVDTMNDYEITITATEAVFRVNGALAGTIAGRTPTGVLNVFFSTHDGGAGNVPVSIERLSIVISVSGFDLWRATKFEPAELIDGRLTGPNAVYAADGLPNLVKYALGLEPKQPHTGAVLELGVTASDWIATYTRPASVTDVTCSVQVSTNLTDWTTTGVTLQRVATLNGMETWQASHSRTGTPRLFFRLKVTRP